MTLKIAEFAFKELKDKPLFAQQIGPAIALFREMGLFNFLRRFARPMLVDGGKDVYAAAAQAAFNDGYHKCLDDIEFFQELYLQPTTSKSQARLDFGGRSLALAKGDILPSDLENGKFKHNPTTK